MNNKRRKKRWTLKAARGLFLNNKPVLVFQRYGNDQDGYTLSPWQADRLCRVIVAHLNDADAAHRAARARAVAYMKALRRQRGIK